MSASQGTDVTPNVTIGERSVAEIIGWVPVHEFEYHQCVWCDSPEAYTPVAHCPDNSTPPTPDDMLAWLRGRGLHRAMFAPRRGGGGMEWFASFVGDGFDWNADDDHPEVVFATPSAALEAAVRAVAEAS